MKQFTTITLRALDSNENTDIVRIMNLIMNKKGLKTGQSVIEFIIRDYIHKSNQLDSIRVEFNNYTKKAETNIRNLSDENDNMKATMKLFNEFSKLVKKYDK